MKRKYSALLLMLFAIWLINSDVLVSRATSLAKASVAEVKQELSDTSVGRKFLIENRYRTYKGKLQYRRWNVTDIRKRC